MRQNSSVGTILYFVLSTAFHGGVAYALVSVAQMQMGSEGHSEAVEFVTTESVAAAAPQVAPAQPEPLAPPVKPIETPAKPSEEKAPPVKKAQTKPKAKPQPEPITELPQKVVIEEEPTNEEAMAVISHPIAEAPETATPETATLEEEALPVVEEMTDLESAETTTETSEESLVPVTTEETTESASEEAAQPEVIVVPLDEIPAEQQPTTQGTGEAAGALGAGNGSALRSYTDLKQAPGNKPPRYPTLARRQSQQGQVQLSYFVQKDGRVSDVKIVKSSGYPLLDQEAVRAVSLFQYQAGQEGWAMHPVDFQLQGPVKKTPSRLRTSSRDPNS